MAFKYYRLYGYFDLLSCFDRTGSGVGTLRLQKSGRLLYWRAAFTVVGAACIGHGLFPRYDRHMISRFYGVIFTDFFDAALIIISVVIVTFMASLIMGTHEARDRTSLP